MSRRAAIYLRQSKSQDEGIERQRKRCTALATARDWPVVAEYVDNDVSASKARGAGTSWARMLADAETGAFDVLIAVDLDRLLRRVDDLGPLTATGAKVLTVDGEIDLTTADGEFRATMLAGIARFEVRRKSERQQRANAQRAEQGHYPGGRRGFGYTTTGEIIPAEADAIRDGYAALLAGVSLTQIARDWHALGLYTGQQTRAREGAEKSQSAFRNDNVRRILKNPRMAGKRAYRGEIVAEGLWEPIVDESTWLAAQAILGDPARFTGGGGRSARQLLSGFALCGICGATVHGGGANKPGMSMYRCSGSYGHFGRQAGPVEDHVVAQLLIRLEKSNAAELLHDTERADVGALRQEAQALRARLDALAVEFADGSLTTSQLRTATERMRARLAAVEADMADAGRVDVLGALIGAEDVAQTWIAMSRDRQRAVLDTLMIVRLHPPGRGTRTFRPESVGIEWKQ